MKTVYLPRLLLTLGSATAFVLGPPPNVQSTTTRLWSEVEAPVDPYAIPTQCFLVFEDLDDIDMDEAFDRELAGAAEPLVVCTNDPEDYAWFHGLDEDALVPIGDNDSLEATESLLECVETENHRGFPTWECLGSDRLLP